MNKMTHRSAAAQYTAFAFSGMALPVVAQRATVRRSVARACSYWTSRSKASRIICHEQLAAFGRLSDEEASPC